ncbi:MAG: PD-(D/E)XK nuclease family protein, partial [Flavobacteriaceae bacterium]|nr:PD-(D/E)XK nuclease family protein [Flavobacteriaceae bacterium]
MHSFISDTLNDVLKTHKSFENTVFILPSQRAGVFVNQAIQHKITAGFLPEIIPIETFTEAVSGIHKIDTVQLLFHFYTTYKNKEENPETFDSFSSWAHTVLQDFNEVDQHLVDPNDLFTYLKDIQRLKEWSIKNPIEETELMKNHFSFMKKLGSYYTSLYSYLVQKKIGYQGLMYREAAKNIHNYCQQNIHKNYVFMGFNALNKAEEVLFQKMLANGNATIYWDIDQSFLTNNHQAGTFIRKYQSEWTYYQTNELKLVSNHFSEQKNLEVIGASKNVTQIKHVSEILDKLPNYNNTAFVLADESLLPIALNSLPKKVQAVNITMGYPLKDIPTTALFSAIFQLFLTQEKLHKTGTQEFYYKDVNRFFKQPAIYRLLFLEDKNVYEAIATNIAKENSTFISFSQLKEFLTPLNVEVRNVLLTIFKPFENTSGFIDRISTLIELLKEDANALEKEYLFRFYTAFTQLQNLQSEFNYLENLKILHQFFKQLITLESMSFQGEPLQGLQLMGMLETRVLDFENVIISSVNEGVLPAGNSQSSFIPFDVKIAFDLPTYKEKDAIFSYHFFRLMQRAKNIFLLYNTENDMYGGGEKSRFIAQLLLSKEGVTELNIRPKIITEKKELKEIEKSKAVLIKLKALAEKGISPSALTNYLHNPFDFYKQKVLGIYEYKEVEETVASNTMGTIVHDTLEALYKPFEGSFITIEDLVEMEKKSVSLVDTYFKKHFNNDAFYTGKNRLIFEVSNRFVLRFITEEKKLLQAGNKLKIIATEKELETVIHVNALDFPIKIKGIVDRIDELNGVTRIIDYKTGLVQASELKITDFSALKESYKHSKAIQVMLYAFLHVENNQTTAPVEAGIISFKNLKSGVLHINFSE